MRGLKRAALVATLSVVGLMSMAGAASAAGLYTNSGLGTLVTTGSTATGVDNNGVVLQSGQLNNTCSASTLTATVTANSGSGFVQANIGNSSWSSCALATRHTSGTVWQLKADTADYDGGTDTYPGRVDNVSVQINFFFWITFAGNIVDERIGGPTGSVVEWDNNGASGAFINLSNAGTIGSDGRVTGDWDLQGTAANWTLG